MLTCNLNVLLVDIIMVHVDINKSDVNFGIKKSHVIINMLHVNVISLACTGSIPPYILIQYERLFKCLRENKQLTIVVLSS